MSGFIGWLDVWFDRSVSWPVIEISYRVIVSKYRIDLSYPIIVSKYGIQLSCGNIVSNYRIETIRRAGTIDSIRRNETFPAASAVAARLRFSRPLSHVPDLPPFHLVPNLFFSAGSICRTETIPAASTVVAAHLRLSRPLYLMYPTSHRFTNCPTVFFSWPVSAVW